MSDDGRMALFGTITVLAVMVGFAFLGLAFSPVLAICHSEAVWFLEGTQWGVPRYLLHILCIVPSAFLFYVAWWADSKCPIR